MPNRDQHPERRALEILTSKVVEQNTLKRRGVGLRAHDLQSVPLQVLPYLPFCGEDRSSGASSAGGSRTRWGHRASIALTCAIAGVTMSLAGVLERSVPRRLLGVLSDDQ
jgi:hypothetical protein